VRLNALRLFAKLHLFIGQCCSKLVVATALEWIPDMSPRKFLCSHSSRVICCLQRLLAVETGMDRMATAAPIRPHPFVDGVSQCSL
jgi:hypothetical protein